jgi:hypothetical protein
MSARIEQKRSNSAIVTLRMLFVVLGVLWNVAAYAQLHSQLLDICFVAHAILSQVIDLLLAFSYAYLHLI